MDQDRSEKPQETTELGVAEAMTSGPSGATTCPTCNRQVEAGFRFCDYCGTKLEAGPLKTTQDDPGRPSLLERVRSRRNSASEKTERPAVPKTEPLKTEPPKVEPPKVERPHVEDLPPLSGEHSQTEDLASLWGDDRKGSVVERLRARRREGAERAAASLDERMTPDTPLPLPPEPALPVAAVPTEAPPVPGPVPAPSAPRSQMTKAGDLKAATSEGRAGISGRLRWQGEPAPVSAEPPLASSWRPASPRVERSTAGMVAVFFVHLVVSFLVGAALLGIAAVVASLTSDGRVALLEIRGLPIFIAGATAIIVFALMRTGPRRQGSSRAVAISVFAGFIVLVIAVAAAYQPSVMASVQSRLDRSLGVFGTDVAEGVQRYVGDLDLWNAEVSRYRDVHLTDVLNSRKTETDPKKFAVAEETFRNAAANSEVTLEGLTKRMRSHADAIRHAPLRDALDDLTAIFADELSGIRSISRGLTNNDTTLTKAGDSRFKDATQRAVDFFDERVRPILERGDLDADSFGLSVEMLRG